MTPIREKYCATGGPTHPVAPYFFLGLHLVSPGVNPGLPPIRRTNIFYSWKKKPVHTKWLLNAFNSNGDDYHEAIWPKVLYYFERDCVVYSIIHYYYFLCMPGKAKRLFLFMIFTYDCQISHLLTPHTYRK